MRVDVVPHWQNPRKWDICHREGGGAYQDWKVLCLQGHQQEAHGGAGVHGTPPPWSHGVHPRRSAKCNAHAALHGTDYFASQVRNEIAVLKRVSKGHPNIVTLHDYFEVGTAIVDDLPSF